MGRPLGELCYLAKQNGSSAGQYHTGKTINVRTVVEALEKSCKPERHPAIRRGARILLQKMAQHRWKVTAGPHKGGSGGSGYKPDQENHITIQIRRGYHLRMDKRGHLYQIVGPGIDTVKPWIAPGS